MDDMLEAAKFYHSVILSDMDAIRNIADAAEELLPESALPYPNYEQLLFY